MYPVLLMLLLCLFSCVDTIIFYGMHVYKIHFNVLQFFNIFCQVKLVEALRYKLEDRSFDSQWYHWNFSLT